MSRMDYPYLAAAIKEKITNKAKLAVFFAHVLFQTAFFTNTADGYLRVPNDLKDDANTALGRKVNLENGLHAWKLAVWFWCDKISEHFDFDDGLFRPSAEAFSTIIKKRFDPNLGWKQYKVYLNVFEAFEVEGSPLRYE